MGVEPIGGEAVELAVAFELFAVVEAPGAEEVVVLAVAGPIF